MVLQVFRECSTHLYQSYPCIQTQTIHVHLSSTMFIPEVQLAICLELVTTKYPRTITIPPRPKLIGLHNTFFWGINNFLKSFVCAFHFLKQRKNEFQHYTYELWFSLCKIVRSSVILLLPLLTTFCMIDE
jgi:hypothetical protein